MRILTSIAAAALIAATSASLSAQAVVSPAAQARQFAVSKIVEVTVYADRALVTRRAEASLAAGESTVVFTDLPSAIDPASIQVSGSGAFTLRDVRVTSRQVVRDVSAKVRELEDTLAGLAERLQVESDKIRQAEAERVFLADIAKRLTSNAGESESLPLDTVAWARMLDFHRARNEAVDTSLRAARKTTLELKSEMDRVQRELRSLGSGSRLSVLEAEVSVEAKGAAKVNVELSYLVSGPSWAPDYVVRAESEAAKLSVHYRALVRQNTGESWKDASLRLSTARPQVGGSLPKLAPWFVDVYEPAPVAKKDFSRGSRVMAEAPAPAPSVASGADKVAEVAAPEPEMDHALAGTESGATAVLFSIPGLTTVESDNKERTVTVAVLELPVVYSWAAVPKLSPYAYFRALATNSSDFPFLPGDSHVYVDGSYVADASMGSVPPGGEFRADLGIDESVSVERKLKKKYDSSSGMVAKRSKTTWEYTITVKNAKRGEVLLTVSDQVPISSNDQISVKTIEPVYTKDSDTLKKLEGETFEWSLKLAPGKEEKIPLSFSVEYPKGLPVTGLE